MKSRNPFTKVLFTAAIIIFFSATISQGAIANEGFRSPVGSWLVEITPADGSDSFANLATLNQEGTIITSDPVAGAGHGAWKQTGTRDFEVKFLELLPPDSGFPAGSILTVTASLTIDDSGDEANGTNIGEFSDSAGNVIAVVAGDVSFTRIEVD